jgi:hypothetical protein
VPIGLSCAHHAHSRRAQRAQQRSLRSSTGSTTRHCWREQAELLSAHASQRVAARLRMHAGMLRVLLCRHGETHDNVARLTQGHAPGALTQTGRAQAAALAARLATTPHDAVYCSDLRRAVETLRIVADAAQPPHPPATLLPLLRERGAGVFEGTPLGTVDAAAVAAGAAARSYRPDGGESWQDVRKRAAAALQL